ncbi:LOW QUALITY PROTEIN: hypothetical protein TorRG33x02_182540 [Trema orientale]|uniref:Uncharacterized protein n=1 Tax=Trema orientale TaxID=63057 RepID=A0A2P5EK73_TREOI|nr:LOW QUALITY PROTEIN: hypothetical protein TorRG33x02_182540 [Trema orientale]
MGKENTSLLQLTPSTPQIFSCVSDKSAVCHSRTKMGKCLSHNFGGKVNWLTWREINFEEGTRNFSVQMPDSITGEFSLSKIKRSTVHQSEYIDWFLEI